MCVCVRAHVHVCACVCVCVCVRMYTMCLCACRPCQTIVCIHVSVCTCGVHALMHVGVHTACTTQTRVPNYVLNASINSILTHDEGFVSLSGACSSEDFFPTQQPIATAIQEVQQNRFNFHKVRLIGTRVERVGGGADFVE